MKRWLAGFFAVLGLVACQRQAAQRDAYYLAEPVHLAVPKLPGWTADPTLDAIDPNRAGGTVLRLLRQSSVAGSPRIDLVLEPPTPNATMLEDLLAHNLRQMATLEDNHDLHIDHVDQKRITLGSRPAYRVHHEYTVGRGASQVAINQVSLFVVIDGRGVAMTAAGRTELYHPLADSIEAIFNGLKVGDEKATAGLEHEASPVDLGRVGGRK